MKTAATVFTIINYVLSSILWLLGVLVFAFNILGYWQAWHIAGFAFVFYSFIPILPQILAIVFSFRTGNKATIILNFASLAISATLTIFTLFVSTTWFW